MTKTWLVSAYTRAIKTMAQAAIASIGVAAVSMADVDLIMVLSSAALAGILSVLSSFAGLPEVTETEKVETITEAVIEDVEEPVEEVSTAK